MEDRYDDILKKFISCEIEPNTIASFIVNNKDIIDNNIDGIVDRLFMLYNNKDLYCVLLTIDDLYLWSLYKDGKFLRFRNGIEEKNGIVNKFVDMTNSEKVKETYPNLENSTVEDRFKKLKKINMNSNGYHFK